MIIKRLAVGQPPEINTAFSQQEKNATPRVIIKLKKKAKVQLCRLVSEESVPEGESNFFNDSEYFNYQHKHGHSHRQYKGKFAHPRHVQTIRNNKPKQNCGDLRMQQTHNEPKQDLSRNLFLEFFKKQSIQAPQNSQIPPSEDTSQRHRKYSCPSNRKDIFQNIAPAFSRGSGSVKQQQNSQQLMQLNLKPIKENHSCYVVNPYTKKEYFHQRVTQSSSQQRRKNFKSLDYSIIKPNEIRAVPFSNRDQKSMAKRKTERKQFPQLLAALKRKEQLSAQRSRMRREKVRMMVHTSYLNRRKEVVVEERNQLQPWEVDGGNNFGDMM